MGMDLEKEEVTFSEKNHTPEYDSYQEIACKQHYWMRNLGK